MPHTIRNQNTNTDIAINIISQKGRGRNSKVEKRLHTGTNA